MPQVDHATPETFDALVTEARDELVVVYFWGPKCPNCEVFAANLDALLEALDGERVRLVKVNAYEHDALATRFAIFGIPQFHLFRDGRHLGRMSEFVSRPYWLAVVREHLPTS